MVQNGQCVYNSNPIPSCGSSAYVNGNNVCVSCSNDCASCSSPSCSICDSGFDLTNGICV